ncbi:tyrosine-protein phosphatase [Micromonospora sp. WMMD736]|uniref:tyrosine-protein phosphatase n=1 Tax=Micromonospora sp. WMMD736 TaxID=3404112 RepID=UPI003B93949A
MSTFANFRDIGGLPLTDGGQTRSGVLLRCSAPIPGDALPADLQNRAFTVVDLRSAVEQPQYEWPPNTVVVRHNLFEPGDLSRLRDVDLSLLYRDMLATAAERIVAVAHMLDSDGPTLVHCTAGKDRTGVVVAVLLLLSGVEPAAILADYCRTELAMPAVVQRLSAIGAIDTANIAAPWYAAPAAAIEAVMTMLTQYPGGARAWFLDRGGRVDALNQLRQRLRDGGAAGSRSGR